MPAPEAQQQEAEPVEVQSTPGIVMLESYEAPREAERSATSPAASSPPPASR
jgi:hypothetical protein